MALVRVLKLRVCVPLLCEGRPSGLQQLVPCVQQVWQLVETCAAVEHHPQGPKLGLVDIIAPVLVNRIPEGLELILADVDALLDEQLRDIVSVEPARAILVVLLELY